MAENIIPIEKTYFRDKFKITLLAAIATLMCLVCIWLFVVAHRENMPGSTLIKSVSVAGFLFFSTGGFYIFQLVFSKKPALALGQEGIYNYTNATGIQFIPWHDITGIETGQMKGNRFLLVYINDPKRYIKGAKGARRILMAMNHRVFGTPISITVSALKVKYSDLLQVFEDFANKYHTGLDQPEMIKEDETKPTNHIGE